MNHRHTLPVMPRKQSLLKRWFGIDLKRTNKNTEFHENIREMTDLKIARTGNQTGRNQRRNEDTDRKDITSTSPSELYFQQKSATSLILNNNVTVKKDLQSTKTNKNTSDTSARKETQNLDEHSKAVNYSQQDKHLHSGDKTLTTTRARDTEKKHSDSETSNTTDSNEISSDRRKHLFRRSISLRRSLFRNSQKKKRSLELSSAGRVVVPPGVNPYPGSSTCGASSDSGIEDTDSETSSKHVSPQIIQIIQNKFSIIRAKDNRR